MADTFMLKYLSRYTRNLNVEKIFTTTYFDFIFVIYFCTENDEKRPKTPCWKDK